MSVFSGGIVALQTALRSIRRGRRYGDYIEATDPLTDPRTPQWQREIWEDHERGWITLDEAVARIEAIDADWDRRQP